MTYTAEATIHRDGTITCNVCNDLLEPGSKLHEHMHNCPENRMERVDHPVNRQDSRAPGSSQGYQIFKCIDCGDYWGCRYQYDAGTGSDDKWIRFKNFESIKRHY